MKNKDIIDQVIFDKMFSETKNYYKGEYSKLWSGRVKKVEQEIRKNPSIIKELFSNRLFKGTNDHNIHFFPEKINNNKFLTLLKKIKNKLIPEIGKFEYLNKNLANELNLIRSQSLLSLNGFSDFVNGLNLDLQFYQKWGNSNDNFYIKKNNTFVPFRVYENIIRLFNISKLVDFNKIDFFLEHGGGVGPLASIIIDKYKPKYYVLSDIPHSLFLAYNELTKKFPNSTFYFNENFIDLEKYLSNNSNKTLIIFSLPWNIDKLISKLNYQKSKFISHYSLQALNDTELKNIDKMILRAKFDYFWYSGYHLKFNKVVKSPIKNLEQYKSYNWKQIEQEALHLVGNVEDKVNLIGYRKI